MLSINYKALLVLAFIGGLVSLTVASPSSAQTCDYPLIVQSGNVAPNILWILDNSGSMNEVILHEEYDWETDYSGSFESTWIYWVGAEGDYDAQDFNNGHNSSDEAHLVPGVNGQWGRYLGNYLNWVYYHATDDQRNNIPTQTRMEVGQLAVNAIMNQVSGLRYGLMTFDFDTGGVLNADLGTDVSTLTGIVDGTAGTTWTPSAETMMTALNHFKDPNGPIQYECQQNFIIFVTDGFPTQDLNIPGWIGDQDGDGRDPGDCGTIGAGIANTNDCSDYLDDVAYYMANNDLRADMDGDQNVFTYTIGFGIDAPLLRDTADNGQGLYRIAWDLDSLVWSLSTIVGDIVQRISSGAAVAVVSTEAGANNQLYRGKFMPGQWRGFLEAYQMPVSDASQPVWEAGSILAQRTPDSRAIFTVTDSYGTMVEFESDHAADLKYTLGLPDITSTEDVIDWVRGKDIAGMRDRNGWKLGDLVYSTPVIVGPPSQFILDAGYQAFIQEHRNRDFVLYVGANDGMLHAIRAATGDEVWGYIPLGVHAKLPDLTDPNYCHQTFVDLSPTAFDVEINGSWKTVLFGGERTGGDTYFAIDVTDPYAPVPLWETSLPTSSFTEPVIARTEAYGTLLWAGSGPDITGNAWITGIMVDNGATLFNVPLLGSTGINMMSAGATFDKNYDGYVDAIYQGDLDGNLWKIDTADAGGLWYITKLFKASEPIQARPAVTVDDDGNAVIMFGTGKYIESADVNDMSSNRFYVITDKDDGVQVTMSDLVDQTSSINDTDGYLGWHMTLIQQSGERVVEPATIVEGVLYFTSFAPSIAACSAGGTSYLYAVNFETSAGIVDEEVSDDIGDRVRDLGDGVASRPVINLGSEDLIVQTSDARLNIEQLSLPPQIVNVRSWREMFDSEFNPDGTMTQETPDP